MPDLDINCAECGSTFPFTEREQDYYRERGLTHPKRCKPCRDARRQNSGGGRRGMACSASDESVPGRDNSPALVQ